MKSRDNSNLGKLKNGNIPAPPPRGGRREGAGRKPNAFRLKCRELANSEKYFEWAKGVIDGTILDQKMTKDGYVVELAVSVGDRKELWKDIAAYGEGKPIQGVEVSGNMRVGFLDLIGRAEKERGLEAED